MKSGVSACLVGVRCRYDGGSCRRDCLPADAIAFCPEQLGGLETPREPAEIAGGEGADVLAGHARVLTKSGLDVTDFYVKGARRALEIIQRESIRRVYLKGKSPSCGAKGIYDGSFSSTIRPGMGVLAALLTENGIEVVNID